MARSRGTNEAKGLQGHLMLLMKKPSESFVRQFVEQQSRLDFSYEAVGSTAGTPPPGFVVDRTSVQLGEGNAVFDAATAALRRWHQFRLGWVEATPSDTPIEERQTVAVLARAMGLWSLNACRIIYVRDQQGPARVFGFAYGTLPDHLESGEERFLIRLDPTDGSVWYEILAFSRPKQMIARLGYPVVRRYQRRFAQASAAAMRAAVSGR